MSYIKLKTIFPIICVTLLISGCFENKLQESALRNESFACDTIPKLTFASIDTLTFRNSYARHKQLSSKEFNRIKTCNPKLSSINEEKSIPQLEKLGIVKGNKLLLFKFRVLKTFLLESKRGNILRGQTDYLQPDPSQDKFYNVSLSNTQQSVNIELHNEVMNQVKIALVDFIPGGFKEIIVLRKYYIANGDNYDLIIYEIK